MRISYLSSVAACALLLGACGPANLPSGGQLPGTTAATPIARSTGSGPAATPKWGQRAKTSGCRVDGALPDSSCTPGDILPRATKEQICVPGYSRSVRNVPTSVKDEAYAEYGIASHTPGEYEVDHLVSLELGGSNDISNLWPEAAAPTPGFHEKDEVENFLHDQVCAGAIPLAEAQVEIARDWMSVYAQMTGAPVDTLPQAPAPAAQPGEPTDIPLPPIAAVPTRAIGEGGVPPDGVDCPDDFPIKGNVRSDGTKIYHTPRDSSYKNTHPEQCFATAADAEAAGFRAPKR